MNPQPFELIEEAAKRANALRRTFFLLALYETNPTLKAIYEDAESKAKDTARDINDLWDTMLVISMQNWEARAGVTIAEFKNANKQLQRSITEIQNAVNDADDVVRAIRNLEKVATAVAKVASI